MKFRVRFQNFSFLFPALFFLFLGSSCTSLYFSRLPTPQEPPGLDSLKDLPFHELWSGFVFNGEKVGFTRIKIFPEGEDFRIQSEAHMRLRLLGMEQRIALRGEDIVRPDLTLVSFRYEQKIDEKSWVLSGEILQGQFRATLQIGDETKTIETWSDRPIYPSSAVNLYPVLQGLVVGARYQFLVFDPQIQEFAEVSQEIIKFETNKDLGLPPAYKMETRMAQQKVFTWISLQGEAIFEQAMNGMLVTHKEEEEQAKRFLSEASLNKRDLILDFSLVKTDVPLPCPQEVTFLAIALEGVAGELPILQGPGQETTTYKVGEKAFVEYILRVDKNSPLKWTGAPLDAEGLQKYLAPTFHLESDHPAIQEKAKEITADAPSPMAKVRSLARWVSAEVKDELVDSISALEVLQTRKGECQAHTMLYVALARAAGIPTRLVGGLVYAQGRGFLYHSWAESYLDGWIAVDPTYNQVGVDATHIKLVEGSSWASMIAIGRVVGRIKATISNYRASCKQ
jgi:hypothetical protein